MEFRVEVENRTQKPILWDSSALTFTTCEKIAGVQEETCSLCNHVLDPEKMIIDLDLQRAREKANHANSQGFRTAMILLNANATIASSVAKRYEKIVFNYDGFVRLATRHVWLA